MNLHARYSTNPQGWYEWLFTQYDFQPGNAILELGCGNAAQWAGRMEKLPPGARLVLSDFSEGMLEAARERIGSASQVGFRQIDIQRILYADHSFDAVIANHMLYHAPDLDGALREVRRVLKPGGVFYASTFGEGGLTGFLRRAFLAVNPASEAFAQTHAFTLQNGEAALRKVFADVQRRDHPDSLRITNTEDLMQWLQSNMNATLWTAEEAAAVARGFEAMRLEKGYIEIPKETGLFVARG